MTKLNFDLAEPGQGVAGPPPLFDGDKLVEALNVLVDPGAVFEIRILEPRRAHAYSPQTLYGYFDDPRKVPPALHAARLAGAKGIYMSMNPMSPALLARTNNHLMDGKANHTTADKDILRRRWLLIDVDPERPAGISSTDAEKAIALERARSVYAFLRQAGWPEPIIGDSGNGYHLLYRIDLLPDDDRVKRCLDALGQRFTDAAVKIDSTVGNAARIVKLYGTLAAKGAHCPENGRPHRMSCLVRVPDVMQVVPVELLDALAAEVVSQEPPRAQRAPSRAGRGWDRPRMQEFIDTHLANCQPGEAKAYDGGFKWVLGTCPFNPDHNDHSAVIVIKADGMLGFKCHHDGCKGNNWKALRAKFEPGRDEAPTGHCTVIPGDEELVQQFGAPIMTNSKGEPTEVNQLFMAQRFERDNLILHEPALNQFYEYDGETGLWRPKTEARLAVDIGQALHELLRDCGCEKALKKRTENLLGQILRLLKGVAEREGAFRRETPVIHVGNGVLHLDGDTPELRPFSHEYYSRNRSETCFEPAATCPRFLNELLRPALCDEDISLLQRYAGQCLLGRNLSQIMLLLRGTPGGGKTTLVNVLEAVIGLFNVGQLRVHHLAERFEIAGFTGKTLLSGRDVPGDFLNNSGAHVLKALVGGDRLDAEQKNVKHRFEVIGDFNVIITSNSRLRLRLDSDSGAWRRRLAILDYNRPPTSKPIANLDRELVATEGPGILNWCIEGAQRLLEELRETGRLRQTAEQMKRVEDLLCESDSVRHFVTDHVGRSTHGDVTVAELQTGYHTFCEAQGWQAVSTRQFENQVGDMMMEIHRVAKRNDVSRNNKRQRGFGKVTLKGMEAAGEELAQEAEYPSYAESTLL